MNLKEITERTREVKILFGEYAGVIEEVYSEDYRKEIVRVGDIPMDFGKGFVQEMTPLSYKGERIGIGDTVNGRIVYDFSWFDGEWNLKVVLNGDLGADCWNYHKEDIHSHTPLYQSNKQTDAELLAEVERRGLTVSVKALK